jgi:ankyrin repeat protein
LSKECAFAININEELIALHFAAWTGNVEVLETKRSEGLVDVTRPNGSGWTALHLATWNMHTQAIELLLRSVALDWVSAQTNDGLSALHMATLNNDITSLKVLLRSGADVSAQDRMGRTALHWAGKEGYVEIMRELEEAGAAILGSANDGFTPMDWAAKGGHVEAVQEFTKLLVNSLKKEHMNEQRETVHEIISELRRKMSQMTFTLKPSPSTLQDKWSSLAKQLQFNE